jgi:hypothetical protein
VAPAHKKYIVTRLRNFLPTFTLTPDFMTEFGSKPNKTAVEVVQGTITLGLQSQPWVQLFVSDLEHVASVRSHTPFFGGVGTHTSSEYGPKGEELLRLFAGKKKLQTTKKTMLASVNHWMWDRFHAIDNLRLRMLDESGTVRSLVANDPGSKIEVNIAAMGEGVSQVLPIIAAVLRTRKDDCLLIEQPEIHLHPSLQADLADLLLEVVNVGHRQLIVETHSEHLLLRLRRRIAEGRISPEKVAVLFVEKEGSESRIRRLDINKHGHFDDWPKGFFDQAYQDAMNLAMAQPSR